MRPFKYGNTRVSHSGLSFASKLEAALYDELKLREMGGELSGIRCQVHVKLTLAQIVYIADFMYTETKTNTLVWAEAKGYKTPEWAIKKRLWKFYGPGRLDIYEGSYKRLTLTESLTPTIL